MKEDDEICDLWSIDVRSLTGDEWHALTKRLIERAHVERSRTFRRGLGHLKRWILGGSTPQPGKGDETTLVYGVHQNSLTDSTRR